jgi:PhoH-like ATPase
MQQRGLIEIEAISFIRGRSIPNAYIIIDEAQNLSMHELKTIVTRVGEGTKIVLTGDIEQIDNVDVDAYTNGLTYAIEKFKEYPIAAHVTLLKGERSPLATLASKIL